MEPSSGSPAPAPQPVYDAPNRREGERRKSPSPEDPKFDGRALWVLIGLAADVALLLVLLEYPFKSPLWNIVTKVGPWVCGAGVLVLVKTFVRTRLRNLCGSPAFAFAVFGFLVLISALHLLGFVPADLRVHAAPGATVFLDGAPHTVINGRVNDATLSFRRKRVIVNDNLGGEVRADTFVVGFFDRLLATAWAQRVYGRVLELGNTYQVTVFLDSLQSPGAQLEVTGRYSRAVLRSMRRSGKWDVDRYGYRWTPMWLGLESPLDSARASTVLSRTPETMPGSNVYVDLPAGSYEVTIVDGECRYEPALVSVRREETAEITLGMRGCRTSR